MISTRSVLCSNNSILVNNKKSYNMYIWIFYSVLIDVTIALPFTG